MSIRKGIILAGGAGTRLYPATRATNKQLIPVYDKPMVFYPLSTLILAGVSDILLITTADDLPRFHALFGDGGRLGLSIQYAVQAEPKGLAHAFVVGERFVGNDHVALILGDNIFYGSAFESAIRRATDLRRAATIFALPSATPEAYGVVSFDDRGAPISVEEKPPAPTSNLVVPGFYFYDASVVAIARELAPSPRGQLEITDVNTTYLARGQLTVERLDGASPGHDAAWFDAGTPDALLRAANFVAAAELCRGRRIGSVEEAAYRAGRISAAQLESLARDYGQSSYADYLLGIARGV